jgi:peptidoglycan/xylan/chitin deacetylase (PgdA/CDA1 family)
MYHRLESDRCPVARAEERPWAITASEFDRQMDRLRELGRVGVSMDDVHRALAAGGAVPPEWVALTFDDGNRSDHEHALPALAGRGFRATFFVCVERVGEADGLSRAMVRELHGAGMHIGSHAMTHRFLTALSASEEEAELLGSREFLETVVSAPVEHFAPPGGRWSSRTEQALRRAGYTAVATSRYGFNAAATPCFAYRRLPVVRSTGPGRFDAMVRAERGRLWSGYVRAGTLGLARHMLGEAAYRRARTVRAGR